MPQGLSRSESRQVKCPYCDAVPGERCLGVRGKRREASHLERMNLARERHVTPRPVTLDLGDEGAELTWEGQVVGRIESIKITLFADALGEPTEGNDFDVDVSEGVRSTEVFSLQEGVGTNDQASFLPDPVNETWELYVTLMERPRAVLTPKVRKWIRDAHEAVGVEMTQQAIRGLAASDYHRDKGYVGIEHAVRAKQNETIEGRVEMMAAKAKAQPAMIANSPMSVDEWVDHFASADVRRVARESINAIDQMMERPDDDNAQLQGTVATRRLSGNGYRPVVEDGRVVRVERV